MDDVREVVYGMVYELQDIDEHNEQLKERRERITVKDGLGQYFTADLRDPVEFVQKVESVLTTHRASMSR